MAAQTVTSIHSVTSSNTGEYSRMKVVNEGAECDLAKIAPSVFHLFNSSMVVAFFGGRVSYRIVTSHSCSIAERLGLWLARAVEVQNKDQVALQQPYVDMWCHAVHAHHLRVEQPEQCSAGSVYFNLQNTNIWCPTHTMKHEVGLMCRGQMHSGIWCSPDVRRRSARPSLVYT